MAWWATLFGGVFGGRGFLTRMVEWWDNRDRRKLLRHAYDNGGIADARGLAEAIAVAEGRQPVQEHPDDAPAPVRAVSERKQPKAIESGSATASEAGSEPP